MYINSPGGSVTAGLAIYDTMQYVLPPISTWCVGQACSMGSLLLAAGTKGKCVYFFTVLTKNMGNVGSHNKNELIIILSNVLIGSRTQDYNFLLFFIFMEAN